MLKLGKKLCACVLTVGCLLGGSMIPNVATAATSSGSYQQEMNFSGMAGQDLLNRWINFGNFNQQQGQQSGQQFGQQSGQQFGQQSGQQFGQQSGQQFGQQSGQQFGQQSGRQFGQQSGQQFGQQSGQQCGQQSGQQCGQQSGAQFGQQQGSNLIGLVASILDVDEQTIIDGLQEGNTLAEIAQNYDVSEDALLADLKESLSDSIDDALAAGNISETQATEMENQLTEYLTQILEKTFNDNNSSSSVLSAPDDLTASAESSDEISLDWDAVSNATSYYIYRSTSYSGNYKKIDSVTSSSYTDSDLSADTTYYYKIKAVNDSGTSAFSSTVHATTDED
jgi:Fibronectin type 3 domain-containing protein